MKLSLLAQRSGVASTTLKHWIRVGIMPPGALRNPTTAEYEQRHIDRAQLIIVLRDGYGASIRTIRSLTDLIDAPGATTLEVLNACQALALGVPADVEDPKYALFRARAHELMRRRDWRGYPGAAERALAFALAQASEVGLDYDVDVLMQYADALEPLADGNVAALHPDASPDVVATRMLLAVRARAQQLAAISSLAHAAAAIRFAIDRGAAPADIAMPPAVDPVLNA